MVWRRSAILMRLITASQEQFSASVSQVLTGQLLVTDDTEPAWSDSSAGCHLPPGDRERAKGPYRKASRRKLPSKPCKSVLHLTRLDLTLWNRLEYYRWHTAKRDVSGPSGPRREGRVSSASAGRCFQEVQGRRQLLDGSGTEVNQ